MLERKGTPNTLTPPQAVLAGGVITAVSGYGKEGKEGKEGTGVTG